MVGGFAKILPETDGTSKIKHHSGLNVDEKFEQVLLYQEKTVIL